MPLAFPSHQGLILPLWRWFPRRIDGVALSVGAAMPDIVDGLAWPIRGRLGQWMGHSLVGLPVCVIVGLALTWLTRRTRLLSRLDDGAATVTRSSLSLAIGALSHIAFDLPTHGNFLVLWPWYRNDHLFPAWWYQSWGGIPVFAYHEPYPVGPHFVAWLVLSAVGAVMFVLCFRRPR